MSQKNTHKYTLFPVLGHSMVPLIEIEDTVEVSPQKNYFPGDIVLFKNTKGQLAVHRIVSKEKNRFVTKGDSGWRLDEPITAAAIQGRVARIHDKNMRAIALPSKREKFYVWLDAHIFQNILMRYKAYGWFRFYLLKILKRLLWFAR